MNRDENVVSLSNKRDRDLLLNEASYDILQKSAEDVKRKDYLTWEEYFMSVAVLSSQRSKDNYNLSKEEKKSGACIVNNQNRIIGIGYNGFPRGCNLPPDLETEEAKEKQRDNLLLLGELMMCTAEINAILNKCSADVTNATMYCTHFPDNESAKVLIQAGIQHIVYLHSYEKDLEEFAATRILFGLANVSYRQFKAEKKHEIVILNCTDLINKDNEEEEVKSYLSWDEYFLSIALLSAQRSKDPNTQVGGCIIDSQNRIVGIGYNGFPRNCGDDILPWSRTNSNKLHTKYPYVCHAEVNAILNKVSHDCNKIYVALFPCSNCAKMIIQAGIKEVVFLSDKYHDTKDAFVSRTMLRMAGVRMRCFIPNKKEFIIQLK